MGDDRERIGEPTAVGLDETLSLVRDRSARSAGRRKQVDMGQVVTAATEVYEEFVVPALFAQFTGPVLSAAKSHPAIEYSTWRAAPGYWPEQRATPSGGTGR